MIKAYLRILIRQHPLGMVACCKAKHSLLDGAGYLGTRGVAKAI